MTLGTPGNAPATSSSMLGRLAAVMAIVSPSQPRPAVIRTKTQVTARALGEARRLLSVGCFCIGTNQVDLAAANERGVPVFNAPFSNTRSVAELIICEVIALARQLGDRSREVHEGRWRKAAAGSFEVRGKTLGVIGYGHIGSQVGVLAEALGLRVIFYDHTSKLPMGNNRACASLAELLAAADFVTLHVPATPQTEKMIGAPELAAMRAGSYLLNAHHNVPGVLRDINRIVSEKGANIQAQVLATDPNIGYLVMDMDQDVSSDVKKAIAALPTSIKTRILY